VGSSLQLATGVGFAIRFVTVSDVLKSNLSEVFLEISDCVGGPETSAD
jgi:hypothetical protein